MARRCRFNRRQQRVYRGRHQRVRGQKEEEEATTQVKNGGQLKRGPRALQYKPSNWNWATQLTHMFPLLFTSFQSDDIHQLPIRRIREGVQRGPLPGRLRSRDALPQNGPARGSDTGESRQPHNLLELFN